MTGYRWRCNRVRRVRALLGAALIGLLATPLVASSAAATAASVSPAPSIAVFVQAQFSGFLGRPPTAAELASWQSQLSAGSTTAVAAIDSIAHHPGGSDDIGAVTRLYSAYFLRPPDQGGLSYWVTQYRHGDPLASISAYFARSSEFVSRYGSLGNQAFVQLVYQNVLGRPGEASGVAYWTAQLDKGKSRGWVMIGFSNSNEYEQAQLPQDEVVLAYTGLVASIPTGADLTSALATYGKGGFDAVAAAIVASAAYAARWPLPPAPSGVTGTAGDALVTLHWFAPPTVSPPIDGYVIVPHVNGVAQHGILSGGTATTDTVTGLTNGTAYTFTVTTVNANGYSAPSAPSAPITPMAPQSWNTYQGDGSHDGYQSSFSLPAQPTLKWSFDFGDDVSYPVIGGGRIFVVVSGTGGAGGYGTRLYAMSEATGQVAWGPIELGGTYWKAGLAYDAGKVFTLNFNGALTAYDAASGTVDWSAVMPSQYEFAGPPVAQNGTVVVEGAGGGSTTFAVNESTGKVLWSTNGRGTQISPDVSGTTVYVTDGCGADAISLATGATIWDASDGCSTGSAGTAVVHGGDLYSPTYTGSGVVRSTATGATVGSYAASTEPAFAGSLSFRLEGILSAVNTAGTTVWTQAGDHTLSSAPVVAGTSVYEAGTSGVVAAYDVSTGTETWHVTLPGGYLPPDEQNFSSPLTGLGIGDHLLVVPSGTYLAVYG